MPNNNADAGTTLMNSASKNVIEAPEVNFTDNNATGVLYDETNAVNDLIVVVIKVRDSPYDLNYSNRYTDTAETITNIINDIYEKQIALDPDNAEIYRREQEEFNKKKSKYTCAVNSANVFLPFVFEGPTPIRKLNSLGEVNEKQEGNDSNVEMLKFFGRQAIHLAFMLQFGNDAYDKYLEYENEWKKNKDKLSKNPGDDHYLKFAMDSIYNLWGQYNGESLGFHRGIDTLSRYNFNVHAIYSGTIIEIGGIKGGYISIYTKDLSCDGGVTITYMHLKFNREFSRDEQVVEGDLLGTQSGYSLKGAANAYPDHTHVEFNKGKYYESDTVGKGFKRPYEDILNVKLQDYGSGKNFSTNPYYCLENIWYRRFFSNVNDNP